MVSSIEKCDMTWSDENVSWLVMIFVLIWVLITVESISALPCDHEDD